MTLLVVIVNYRTSDLVIDCLRSLEAEVGSIPATHVIVVDNASADGSAMRIADAIRKRDWGRWASIQPLESNDGFSAGNNAAIRPALDATDPPRYVLLLNPDTVVHTGALRSLVGFMEARPDVGIAGSRLEYPDGTPQRSAFRFPSVLSELENGLQLGLATRLLNRWVVAPPIPEAACRTDWVSGACQIIRREVFDTVGLLDDGYFMYYEEVDLCRRAALAGWLTWYVPESRVIHLIGQSTGPDVEDAPRRRRPEYWFHSRRRYFQSHLGPARTLLSNLVWASAYASYRFRRVIQSKPDIHPRGLLGDFIRHNFLCYGSRPRSAGPRLS